MTSDEARTELEDRKAVALRFMALPWARQMGNLSGDPNRSAKRQKDVKNEGWSRLVAENKRDKK